ncbi:MAG: aminoacyltransferase [Ruminococcaceae bacterium]|nr:aminoacyltransferase [Oscillospiraceae bacterium]
MTEFLNDSNKEAFEQFVSTHPKGNFMQSLKWGRVKTEWINDAVIVYDNEKNIKGAMNLLIRKVPALPFTIMYTPRGPVCDITDEETVCELIQGAKQLAKKYKSLALKMDTDVIDPSDARLELSEWAEKNRMPDNIINDSTIKASETFIATLKKLGFTCNSTKKAKKFDAIQPRHVFRQDIKGKDEAALMAMFDADARNRIRRKNGVVTEIGTKDDLKAFSALMNTTGERDGFVVRDLSYFEKMYDVFAPENLRLYMAYYNPDNEELIKAAKEEKRDYPEEEIKNNKGQAIAGVIAIYYGNKVWYLYGASGNKFRNKYPSEKLQWEMMKWAIEKNCDVYDFRGIEAKDREAEKNGIIPNGVYRFKKQFRGTYTTFIGEWELPFNKFLNFMFNFAEKNFRELRRKLFVLKTKLSKRK